MSSTEDIMDEDDSQDRPDPVFKFLTRQLADQLGLQAIETEFPQTLRADLILAVPEGLNLNETLFSFFRPFNVIEFKGQNDRLDEYEYTKCEVRTNLFSLQQRSISRRNILTVIVSSRLPQRFFDYMKAEGCEFKAEKNTPWLWRCRVGLQDVAVVVCRDLPLEARYFEWLVFAPADSHKWKEFVKLLVRERNWRLLEKVQDMRPKEFDIMASEIAELLKQASPRERRRLKRDWAIALKRSLPRFAEEDPDLLTEILSGLETEQLVSGLTPEKRQELMKLLSEKEKKSE